MNSVGIIVEYNPFHNGHLHHLRQSAALTGAQAVIAVMSGHFTQRGEPAVISKWERTQMALAGGADLVVELPYAFSCQHGDLFAKGAISLLDHLKVSHLVFGCEGGSLELLKELDLLSCQPHFQARIRHWLKEGRSLPAARQAALAEAGRESDLADLPNNTLGLAYLKALRETGSDIVPHALPRLHSSYHDPVPGHASIASATAVRRLREAGQPYHDYVPKTSGDLLDRHLAQTGAFHTWEHYFPFLKLKILTLGKARLAGIHDMEEGLESAFYRAALESGSFETFMTAIKSRRYTRTRLQRICAHILTGTTKEQISGFSLDSGADSLRILGFSTQGRQYLNTIKKEVSIPIFSKFSASAPPILKHELAVTGAYGAILPEPAWSQLCQREYQQPPLLFP